MSNGVELDTTSQAHLASRVQFTPSLKGSEVDVAQSNAMSSGLSFRESTTARTTIPTSSTPLERTKKQIAAERIQFFAACWALVLAGWNDGTTGPLLPRIQQVYNVRLPCFTS